MGVLTVWYCLPDSFSLHDYNPETPSRVTLAMLGIVFQTNLVVLLFCCFVVLWFGGLAG